MIKLMYLFYSCKNDKQNPRKRRENREIFANKQARFQVNHVDSKEARRHEEKGKGTCLTRRH